MHTLKNKMWRAVLAGMILVGLGTAAGCDDPLTSMLYSPGYTTGLYDGWSGYGGWGGYDTSYPAYDLYDPTSIIQDVVDYRQDVMDWSADAWDAYILE